MARAWHRLPLRYLTQRDVIIIPKSVHRNRMEENFNIYDFELTPDEMERINPLTSPKARFFDHNDPETVKMFMGWRAL